MRERIVRPRPPLGDFGQPLERYQDEWRDDRRKALAAWIVAALLAGGILACAFGCRVTIPVNPHGAVVQFDIPDCRVALKPGYVWPFQH